MMIKIYTDGACRRNPGPGGWCALILIKDHKPIGIKGREAHTTNQRMELKAVLHGLKYLKDQHYKGNIPHKVIVCTDSIYVSDAFNKDWIGTWKSNGFRKAHRNKPIKNQDLWRELIMVAESIDKLEFQHVQAHSGDPFNDFVDGIAKEMACHTR